MSLEYISNYYSVPAEAGVTVIYSGDNNRKVGEIVGACHSHLMVLMDGDKEPKRFHPTWKIEYVHTASLERRIAELVEAGDLLLICAEASRAIEIEVGTNPAMVDAVIARWKGARGNENGP